MRIGLLAIVSVLALGACASPSANKYSVTPETQVIVRGGAKKKAAQANYRVSPEDSKLTGSGGSAK